MSAGTTRTRCSSKRSSGKQKHVEQSDLLEVKKGSSKTHPKPYTASLCSPVCRLQLILQSTAFVPQKAVAKHSPRDKEDREDNPECPAPPETTPRFPASQAPASDNSQSHLLPLHLSAGAGDSLSAGHKRSLVSSPKSSLQLSIRNSTSTFTCTHQSLALKTAA